MHHGIELWPRTRPGRDSAVVHLQLSQSISSAFKGPALRCAFQPLLVHPCGAQSSAAAVEAHHLRALSPMHPNPLCHVLMPLVYSQPTPVRPAPCSPQPAPNTLPLAPAPCPLHPAPSAMHPPPCTTLRPAPHPTYTLHLTHGPIPTTLRLHPGLELYLFRAMPATKRIDVRLDKLDDLYGSPSLDDIERFSRWGRRRWQHSVTHGPGDS